MKSQYRWMAASWCLQNLCSWEYWWEGTQLLIPSSLSSGNVPRAVVNHSQWWIPESIQTWNGHQVLWWCLVAFLPLYIYLFCRLSWKVTLPLCEISILKDSYTCYRILLASIRNLGRCPCPRCLILLDHVPNMGMHRDMAQCMSLAQINNPEWCSHIKAAREIIYVKGFKTDSKAVEDLLQQDSLVPTAVNVCFLLWACWCWDPVTSECVFRQANAAQFQHVRHACCRLIAWGWARCLEIGVYSPAAPLRLPWWRFETWIGPMASINLASGDLALTFL